MLTLLQEKTLGAMYGIAVGDALGGPTEGRAPEVLQERYGGYVEGFVGPFFANWKNARPISPFHKGHGHITDDTLMSLALINVYRQKCDHLDAYDIADLLVPELVDKKTWVPELEEETLLIFRLFYAEKWLFHRLRVSNIDPREAGVGNTVNCGAAMYMAPVGVVNAGNPERAYQEAIEIAGAHQSSYGREAAGVMAAAVAEAMRPGASVDSVVAASLRLAKDGTHQAIAAVTAEAAKHTDWREAIGPLRKAMAPYDTVGEGYRDVNLGAHRPSRIHSIEEVPLALGMLVVSRGDYSGTVLGGVNYGRDSDSIAGMGGAIAGALGGVHAIPQEWRETVASASRKDFDAAALALAGVAEAVYAKDSVRWQAAADAFDRLRGAR